MTRLPHCATGTDRCVLWGGVWLVTAGAEEEAIREFFTRKLRLELGIMQL